MADAPVVFISYSHDSGEHRDRVLGLSERLREDGIETILDRYVPGSPPEGWPRWMLNGIDAATHILCVCTETYYRRFRGHEVEGKGKGVDWEGAIITQSLYDAKSETRRFLPVLYDRADETHIPEPLRPQSFHLLDSEANYQGLYDQLLGQAGVKPGEIGELKTRPRAVGKPATFGAAPSPAPSTPNPSGPNRTAQALWPDERLVSTPSTTTVFTGRTVELAQLTEAVLTTPAPITAIVGQSGEGKSRLLGQWWRENHAALAGRPHALFWCSPYAASFRFADFLGRFAEWLGSPASDTASVLAALRDKPALVVLDGAERWLERWRDDPDVEADQLAGPEDRRPIDEGFAELIRHATARPDQLRLLLATRATPTLPEDDEPAIATIGEPDERTGGRTLRGLDDDAIAELLGPSVDAPRDELIALADEYDRHAHTLAVLGQHVRRKHGRNLASWRAVNPTGLPHHERLQHLRDQVWEHHADAHDLLKAIAVSVVPLPIAALTAVTDRDEIETRDAVSTLADWSLIDFGAEVDTHALRRLDIKTRLAEGEAKQIGLRLVDYWESVPLPDQPQTIEQVTPRINAVDQALTIDAARRALNVLVASNINSSPIALDEWFGTWGQFDAVISRHSAILAIPSASDLPKFDLATSHNNRGNARQGKGETNRALSDFDHAIKLYTELVEQDGRTELREILAMAHNNRGNARQRKNEIDRAIADFDYAIELYTELIERGGHTELRNYLAMSYDNRGIAHALNKDVDLALIDCDFAIKIRLELVEAESQIALRHDLARSLCHRGITVADSVEPSDDEWDDLAKGVNLLRDIVQEGRLDSLLLFAKNAGVRIGYWQRFGPPAQAHAWLATLAAALTQPAALAQAGNAYWRQELNHLAGPLREHAEPLRQLGADPDTVLDALAPYLAE